MRAQAEDDAAKLLHSCFDITSEGDFMLLVKVVLLVKCFVGKVVQFREFTSKFVAVGQAARCEFRRRMTQLLVLSGQVLPFWSKLPKSELL